LRAALVKKRGGDHDMLLYGNCGTKGGPVDKQWPEREKPGGPGRHQKEEAKNPRRRKAKKKNAP